MSVQTHSTEYKEFIEKMRQHYTKDQSILGACAFISKCVQYKQFPEFYSDQKFRQILIDEPIGDHHLLPGLICAIEHPFFKDKFTAQIFPFIIEEAVSLTDRCQDEIKILKNPGSIRLQERQATSLLANMFLCSLPKGRMKQNLPTLDDFRYLMMSKGHFSLFSVISCITLKIIGIFLP